MATERIDIVVSDRGSRTVRRNLRAIGGEATRSEGAVSLLRRALGALSGALVLGSAFRTLASFSQEISTVRAITGATAQQFERLRDTAIALGTATRFTATQAAEGLTFLARAGFNTNEALAAIRPTLTLAQAGALDLGRAADIASNVLRGFNLEADNTTRIVDVLALAANSSNTNVEQLGQAMSFAAPASASLGVSVEETAAAIGVLSDAGVQATRAGTSLRTAFIRLQAPTGAAKRAISEMGLTADQLNIQANGLANVLQTLADANVTLEQAAALVGVRQASNLLILVRGAQRQREFTEQLREAGGTAQNVADIMDDNLNGAILRVRSAFEGLVLSIGQSGAEGTLRGALERTGALLRLMAANAETLTTAIGVLAAVILARLVKGALVLLVVQLRRVAAAVLALSIRTLPLLVSAATAAFGALAAVALAQGKTIEQTFDEIKTSITGVFDSFTEPVGVVNEFERSIGVLADEIERAGGVSKLSQDRITDLIGRIENLKDSIDERLALQQFIAPGSQAVKELTEQSEVLGRALERLQNRAAQLRGEGITPTPTTTPPAGGGGTTATPSGLQDFLRDLDRERELVQLTNREREIREALFRAEDAAERKLTETERQRVETTVRQTQAFEAQQRAISDIRRPAQEYAETMEVLNSEQVRATLSAEELANAQRDARIELLQTRTDTESGLERFFLKLQRSAEDSATQVEEVLTTAFRSAENAFQEFLDGGELDFENFISSIRRSLTSLAFQNLQANLGGALGFGQQTQGGGFLGDLLGGISGLLPGFQRGIDNIPVSAVSVGSLPGLDNRLVAFRARADERVSVSRQGEGSGDRPVIVQFNVTTPDADSFRRSQDQMFADASLAIGRANRRNN